MGTTPLVDMVPILTRHGDAMGMALSTRATGGNNRLVVASDGNHAMTHDFMRTKRASIPIAASHVNSNICGVALARGKRGIRGTHVVIGWTDFDVAVCDVRSR